MKSIAVLILGILFGMLCAIAHAEPRGPKTNATGAVVEYVNPNAYMYGVIQGGTLLGAEKRFTNVRFQPSHSFLFYSETILFCGDQSESFRHATGPIVVTYKKIAHTSFMGIACHEFVSVDHVQSQSQPFEY